MGGARRPVTLESEDSPLGVARELEAGEREQMGTGAPPTGARVATRGGFILSPGVASPALGSPTSLLVSPLGWKPMPLFSAGAGVGRPC